MNIRKAIAQKISNSRTQCHSRSTQSHLLATDYDELFSTRKNLANSSPTSSFNLLKCFLFLPLLSHNRAKRGMLAPSTISFTINKTPLLHTAVITGYSSQQWVEQTKIVHPCPFKIMFSTATLVNSTANFIYSWTSNTKTISVSSLMKLKLY